ncbi:MAG: Hydroxymethylglutaryl-CoA lyase [Nitrospira sp.]|nr:hydroxymethylglutaryl-CoA lyase [Nitrospira sp.]ULA61716.1 MAG: Hydroxymethylglutaryl-CoA lyase [Nitrospira sp.]
MLSFATDESRRLPVRIIEVSPRDGLQHEALFVPTARKIDLINALSRSGVTEIEAGSFISPAAVPQLADSDEVFRAIDRVPGVTYSALVPNERGLERARAAAVQKIAVFTAASDSFTRHNIKATVRESLVRFTPVIQGAKRDGMLVRGYISTAVWCPYEGRMAPQITLDVMRRLLDLGVDDISLGDTLGRASPADMRALLDAVMPHIEPVRLSLHVHDTYGMAVANVLTAWEGYGITAFDCSAGGLGGCPYAPGASGNAATEDVVFALKASGAPIAVDEELIVDCARRLSALTGHPPHSRLSQVPPSHIRQPVLKV